MKTKIIYISGNELFDMADIRAAFEEVRTALSLGPDTVLFGVPVDTDDALTDTKTDKNVTEPIVENIIEPIIEPMPEPVAEKKPRKSPKVVPITQAIKETVTETVAKDVTESEAKKDEPVVPILSVLDSEPTSEVPETDETIDMETIVETENDDITQEPVQDAESVTISDIIADDVPEVAPEKTLEELLETMTPLGEDAEKTDDTTTETDGSVETTTDTPVTDTEDTDIALEKLATEFFENQDKIETPIKPAGRGKIGKLKNILPFKKAKREDSGLMGDLFGWAGVAANDDDFTMPGFLK